MEQRHWAIIVGSHRRESESGRVGRYIAERISTKHKGIQPTLVDLGQKNLPLWDESMWASDPSPAKQAWTPIKEELRKSEAVIVVSPEWGGMVPAALKNLFLYCGSGDLSHKPGYIVGVSSGPGGAYPVAELRMSGYKNTHLCYIPEHLVIRQVEDVFMGDEKDAKGNDQYLRNRLDYGLTVLETYAKAFVAIRQSGVLRPKDYPFGM